MSEILMPTRGTPLRMATCHPDRPHKAKGLCHPCYERQRPKKAHEPTEAERHRSRLPVVAVRCPRCLSVNRVDAKALDGDPRCTACRMLDCVEPAIPCERYVSGLRLAA